MDAECAGCNLDLDPYVATAETSRLEHDASG